MDGHAADPAAAAAPEHQTAASSDGLKARKKEKFPGEWASEIERRQHLLVSARGPRDRRLRTLPQEEGKSILSEERVRVEPFTTSILDGVDLRETIRKWYEGRIYVRQFQKIQGEVGSVIVIFDEDRDNRTLTRPPGSEKTRTSRTWRSIRPSRSTIWWARDRARRVWRLPDGLPPRRMYDVWQDADYEFAESKSERLLLAGIDYSIHRYVVYVAAKPPRTIFKTIASRVGRTIIYIPIGQLSPVSLKKIRVVHVLDGYDKREIAKEFLW